MLNWEYDAEAERRVLTEEAQQQGMQQGMQRGMLQGAELVAKLLKEGFSLEEALEKVKSEMSDVLPS
jgi:predicted transposase YdaD